MSSQQSTESVRRQFGAAAAAYATSAVHAAGPDLPYLVAAAALTGQERVVDLGCGAGHTAMNLAPRAATVTAVDVTPEMLAVAEHLAKERGLGNIVFRQADVATLPFADGAFDVAVSRFSAHHFAEPARALLEAARVLAPGGRFLLVDTVAPEDPALDTFCNAFELLRDASHVRNARASEWVRMITAAGFEAEVLARIPLSIDGDAWVKRMQTPASRVAIIRELFREATASQRAAFELREEPWGFSQPVALIRGTKKGR
jgi:ubiquinone/menaquinone biosynthesis C-methylase UbiE